MPIDWIMFDLTRSETARKLKPVWLIPALVLAEDTFGSDITPHRRERKGWRPRAIKKLAYKVKINALHMVGSVCRQPVPYRDRTGEISN